MSKNRVLADTKFEFSGRQVSIRGYSQSDWIFTSIVNEQVFYEIELLKYMRFALRKRDGLILDVGANIGNHSVFFGMIMKRKVACFEPNPSVFNLLESNLTANHIDYEAYSFGLGEYDAQYFVDDTHAGAKNNVGAAKLRKAPDGQVRVKRLDDIFSQLRFKGVGLSALKADIEGMEPEMLRGALGTLESYKPDLFIEISESSLMKEIEGILYPLGYRKLYSHAATPVWHFSHVSKLPFSRRVELASYRKIVKVGNFPRRVLAAVGRTLKRV